MTHLARTETLSPAKLKNGDSRQIEEAEKKILYYV